MNRAIDASYQVSLHSANQKQELPLAAMFVNGSGQNEQSLERTFHRCFLPSSLHLAEGFISPPVFSGVHVTLSLVLCVSFVDRCLSFSPF
jgi:hypothetical protein